MASQASGFEPACGGPQVLTSCLLETVLCISSSRHGQYKIHKSSGVLLQPTMFTLRIPCVFYLSVPGFAQTYRA
eukprot:1138663-Pelagomonas_calceolata.AAC.2